MANTITPLAHVVLSAVHRPVDGALAARWLATFTEIVENPLRILV